MISDKYTINIYILKAFDDEVAEAIASWLNYWASDYLAALR